MLSSTGAEFIKQRQSKIKYTNKWHIHILGSFLGPITRMRDSTSINRERFFNGIFLMKISGCITGEIKFDKLARAELLFFLNPSSSEEEPRAGKICKFGRKNSQARDWTGRNDSSWTLNCPPFSRGLSLSNQNIFRGGSRGRVQGVRTPPEMKPSSSYWLLEFVYLTGQWRHFLEVHPLLRKILDSDVIL